MHVADDEGPIIIFFMIDLIIKFFFHVIRYYEHFSHKIWKNILQPFLLSTFMFPVKTSANKNGACREILKDHFYWIPNTINPACYPAGARLYSLQRMRQAELEEEVAPGNAEERLDLSLRVSEGTTFVFL